jgi:transposase
MLHVEEWMDIKLLAKQGHSIRAIARLTGCSRNTVANVLSQAAPQPFQTPPRASKLDPYKPYLLERTQQYPLSAVRLLEEIRPMGYEGGIAILRRYLATLAPEKRAKARATVRFETGPGHQAQVDWAHCGRFPDALGQMVSVYCFTMVLGFSRMLYIQFTPSMDLPALLACHLDAFAFFGGWTSELLYDNMAQVRLPNREWNPLFLDFAHHYGFTPRTHRPYRPRTKGKVERMVGYVKDNFLLGRSFVDFTDLNTQGRHWLDQVANVRTHATTGRRPVDLFGKEGLVSLASAAPYRLRHSSVHRVDAEGYVHLHRSRYSLSPEHVGKTVIVEVADQRVIIRAGDLILVEHARAAKQGSCVTKPEHVAAFWQLARPGPSPGVTGAGRPPWQLTFQLEVETTPLSRYAELAEVAA